MQVVTVLRLSLVTAVAVLLAGCPSRTTRVTGAVKLSGQTAPVELPETIEYDGGFAKLGFEQAVELSKRDGKHLFLYFYTEYCGPCKELDKHVFPTQQFERFARSIVSISIDAGSDEGKPAATRYGVNSYPTMVVCRPGGDEIERFFGYHKPGEFIGVIQDYMKGVNTASDYMKRAMLNMSDLALVYQAGRELAIRDRGREAIPFLERIIETRNEAEAVDGPGKPLRSNVPRAMLLLGKTVYLDELKQRDKALPVLEDLSAWYPETFHGSEATYMIARIYIENKDKEKAADVLKNRVVIKKSDAIQYFRLASFSLRYAFMLEDAALKLEEAVQLHPKAGYLWKTLADVYFRLKQYDKAVSTMETAVAREPGSEVYRRILGTYKNALERIRTDK